MEEIWIAGTTLLLGGWLFFRRGANPLTLITPMIMMMPAANITRPNAPTVTRCFRSLASAAD